MSPGPPYQWDIDYGDAEYYDFDGNLFQLTVRRDEASALIYLWSYVDSSFDFDSAYNRYSTIFDIKRSPSSMERYNVIQLAFDKINDHPIIGMGLGNSKYYTKTVTHNPLIVMWLENGIIGLIGMIFIYFIMLKYVYKSYIESFFQDPYLMALTIITLMMIIGDMFMAHSYKRYLWIPSLLMIVQYNKYRCGSLID